jgi:hypothetical protein
MSSTIVRLRSTGLVLALTAGFALLPGVALAEAPTQQGWWAASGSAVPGLPGATTAPDVPEDGLLVEGTSSSPTAYAALSYVLPPGVVAEALVLTVAEGTATTPGQTLFLHPLEAPQFEPVQGGAISEAPAYDPERSIEATVDDSGTTFTFDDLGPLELVTGVAVAVLPDADGGRVVLKAPDGFSLTTSGGSSGTDTTFPDVAPPPSGDFGSDSGGEATGSASGGFAGDFALPETTSSSDFASSPELAVELEPGTELPAVAAEAPVEAAPAEQAPVTGEFLPVAAESGSDGAKRFLAFLVIAAAAAATVLWAFAGKSDPDAPGLPA